MAPREIHAVGQIELRINQRAVQIKNNQVVIPAI